MLHEERRFWVFEVSTEMHAGRGSLHLTRQSTSSCPSPLNPKSAGLILQAPEVSGSRPKPPKPYTLKFQNTFQVRVQIFSFPIHTASQHLGPPQTPKRLNPQFQPKPPKSPKGRPAPKPLNPKPFRATLEPQPSQATSSRFLRGGVRVLRRRASG